MLRFPSINQVAISGRLTQDPDFRITESCKALTTFTIAVNRNYKDKEDQWQQTTTFVPISVWNNLAELAADQLKKGSAVFITGRLNSWSCESEKGKKTILEIVVRNIQFLDKKEKEEAETTNA